MTRLTKSELLRHAHAVTRMKNIAYFGSYQKALAHVLRGIYAKDGLVWGFNV